MLPTLADGDVVFVAHRPGSIEDDDIVAAQHPLDRDLSIVKRVQFTDDDGRLFLRSDNDGHADASDSRSFGPIDPSLVLGRVTSRLSPR